MRFAESKAGCEFTKAGLAEFPWEASLLAGDVHLWIANNLASYILHRDG